MKTNPMLLIDFYKACHSDMLPKGITKSVSYMIPRGSRIPFIDKVVNFGIQGFIKNYLIDYFNEEFFSKPKTVVVESYDKTLKHSLGKGNYSTKKIEDLHDLGYLPIRIDAIKEGMLVDIKIPLFAVTNTHDNFAWLPQALESLISCSLYYPCTIATIAFEFRKLANKYIELSCDDNVKASRLMGDFSYRGHHSHESAVVGSSAWATSFLNSSNVATIPYLEYSYNCDNEKDDVIYGSVSTEHFVANSRFAVEGSERVFIKDMLLNLYPNSSFSMVLDSYDYWDIVKNVIPTLKEEVLNHNGTLLVRGDSGNTVEVITQTVFELWKTFGEYGHINSKNMKVLPKQIRAIYGDSITLESCEEIYKILVENGFSIENVVLGVGSYSMMCIPYNGQHLPITRDTFNFAIKSTYAEINGKPYSIFKAPKEASFKKSNRGCISVFYDENGQMVLADDLTWEEACGDEENLLQPVFKDGQLVREQSLQEIRNILHEGGF